MEQNIEIYIGAARDDVRFVAPLYEALQRLGVRVYWGGQEVGVGDDAGAVRAAALCSAPVGVFFLSKASAPDLDSRGELTAALRQFERDPTRRVIPIYADDDARLAWPLGANVLWAPDLAADGSEVVARRILEALAPLRTRRRLRAAVVAVSAELGQAQNVVALQLRQGSRHPEVDLIDVDRAGAFDDAIRHDFVLVLVGLRTGASDALTRLLSLRDRPPAVDALKCSQTDLGKAVTEEFPAAKALWDRVQCSFGTPEEAAKLAATRFAAWLRDSVGRDAALEAWESAYLRARVDKWASGCLGGLQSQVVAWSLDRTRLYVPLRAAAEPTCYASDDEVLHVLRVEPTGAAHQSESRAVVHQGALGGASGAIRGPYLERVLSHAHLPHLAVEGPAGSGKTVLLQRIAHVLACRHLGWSAPGSQLDEEALAADAPLLRIPVLFEAKHLADLLPRGDLGELSSALVAEFTLATNADPVSESAVRAGLQAGRFLLLIDSLDEVPSVEARERLLGCLNSLVQSSDCRSRVVLTSRPVAVGGPLLAESRLHVARIAALEPEQVHLMVDHWVVAIGEDADYAARLRAALAELDLRHPSGGERSILNNPQLLTCAFFVFHQDRHLPGAPAALFAQMVKILCRPRAAHRLSAETKRKILEAVFECIQRAGGTELEVGRISDALIRSRHADTVRGAQALIEQLADETGLISFEWRRGERGQVQQVARPWHPSFQEYLTASALAAATGSVSEEAEKLVGTPERAGVLFDVSWEAVFPFLVGEHAERGIDRARAFVERLIEHAEGRHAAWSSRGRGRILAIAARCLAKNPQVEDLALRDRLRNEVTRQFGIDGRQWSQQDRLLVLDSLGRLGDPRLEGDLWVDIAGATFTMGGDPGAFNSLPSLSVTVASFRVLWRPVTVQDLKAFVDAGGYLDERWWSVGRNPEPTREPERWRSQLHHPNRPVTGVSWYEAKAYCAWLANKLGIPIDLPTEAEHELSMRGPRSNAFPWGNDEPGRGDAAPANHSGIVGHPTPVGAFPGGNSGRCVDLGGNVWEWAANGFAAPSREGAQRAGPEMRVARGGSWGGFPWDLRGASRFFASPESRTRYIGFRVVCRSPAPPAA